MGLTVRYFAGLRDRAGCPGTWIPALPSPPTIDALVQHLSSDVRIGDALSHPSVRTIVNGEISNRSAKLRDGDEVAFCPPFSGG